MRRRLPRQLRLGLFLVAFAWPLNWGLPGTRTLYLFFPLWLGYILVVDGLNERLTGTSPWRRSKLGFILLFAASIPAWWLFEAINLRTGNWIYLGGEDLSTLAYVLFASIMFSTVVPAVLETAELVASRRWLRQLPRDRPLRVSAAARTVSAAVGLAALAALLVWPRWLYPLVWLFLIGVLLPVAGWRRPSGLAGFLARGDWRPVVALALGAIICGVFWELWNFWSYPRWIYQVPFFGFAHLFEMPLLGYLGYLPFGVEVGLLAETLLGRRLHGFPPTRPAASGARQAASSLLSRHDTVS